MKPPFAYFGGKTNLADRIVSLLPDHRHYVEPYAGSLAVLLAKTPTKVETVNDIDRDLMHFWRILRDRPDELIRVCALTPHSRAEYEASSDRPDDLEDLERARRVWVKLAQGRTGTLRPSGWRHVIGTGTGTTGTGMPTYLAGYVDRMNEVTKRLATVSLECRPALDLIETYGRREGCLLYVDPPYLGSTRSRGYRHEMQGTDEHEALADALRGCVATVVLSGYPSDLYDHLYAGWDRVEIPSHTSQGKGDGDRTEVLWSNRTLRIEPMLPGFANENEEASA